MDAWLDCKLIFEPKGSGELKSKYKCAFTYLTSLVLPTPKDLKAKRL